MYVYVMELYVFSKLVLWCLAGWEKKLLCSKLAPEYLLLVLLAFSVLGNTS